MSARYCKREGCSEQVKGACPVAGECFLFEWDIAREKGDKPQESKLTPKEDEEQKEFAAWLDETGLLWYHTPNERRASVTELVNLTAQGMKKGVPDNFIAEPRGKYHGLSRGTLHTIPLTALLFRSSRASSAFSLEAYASASA